MSIQSTAGYQQDYRNCTHSLNNSFSSMYQPQAQNHMNAHSPSCFETLYDNNHMSSGQLNESSFDNLIDTEAPINHSMATLTASDDLYRGLSDVGVPSMRLPTIQCDPWCSAAMNRQVHSSEMLSWNDALAECGAKRCHGISHYWGSTISRALPPEMENIFHDQSVVLYSPGSSPGIAATTTAATGELARSTRTKDEPLMALSATPVEDKRLHRISWGSASVEDSCDTVHTPQNGHKTSSYSRPPISKDNGTFLELEASELARRNGVEQDHTLQKESNAEGWPDGYPLPFSELPASGDYLDGDPLGVASPNWFDSLAYTPWNANTMTSYPHLPLPQDDGTRLGLHASGFALHRDEGPCHTLGRGLKAEHGPSGYCVPLEYLPACRSNPRRRRRRFTNGEKAVISYKRKIGVCRDCRQAKRKASLGNDECILLLIPGDKCTHVRVDIENEPTKSGAGVIKFQPQASTVFDGPRRSEIGVERQQSDIQGQVL